MVCSLPLHLQGMTRLYRGAGLVHADLSEYNLLWWNDTVHFIDVAQAVDIMHPQASEFLLRDCSNICKVGSMEVVHCSTRQRDRTQQ